MSSGSQREPNPPNAGDQSFERFYEATAPAIRAYLLRHCSDRQAVDDLFQLTFVRFLGSRMAATPEAAGARAYLYRIASNLIADHGRDLKKRGQFEAALADNTASVSPPMGVGLDLGRVLRTLSQRERQLLWLAYAEEFSHKEIARIMKLNAASVRVLLFRVRKKLAAKLRGNGPDVRKQRP